MLEAAPVRVLLVSAPQESAHKLAQQLIERRLAACVNLLALSTSIYQWEGELTTSEEVTMLIKTSLAGVPALVDYLVKAHPYDVPEIITLTPDAVLASYASWVLDEVTRT